MKAIMVGLSAIVAAASLAGCSGTDGGASEPVARCVPETTTGVTTQAHETGSAVRAAPDQNECVEVSKPPSGITPKYAEAEAPVYAPGQSPD